MKECPNQIRRYAIWWPALNPVAICPGFGGVYSLPLECLAVTVSASAVAEVFPVHDMLFRRETKP